MNDCVNIEQMLEIQGYHISTTSGSSMYPMLRNRQDTVILSAVKGRLRKYDVPLYKVGNKYVLHRIIAVRQEHYVIRGDNCLQKEIVSDEQILGVLTEFYRGDKKVNMQGFGYWLYVRFWNWSYPIRYILKRVKGKVRWSRKKKS